jgi:ABC-type uncharacterized transport system ATPase subunit
VANASGLQHRGCAGAIVDLDEPTANLMLWSAADHEQIIELMGEQSILLITHRLVGLRRWTGLVLRQERLLSGAAPGSVDTEAIPPDVESANQMLGEIEN